MIPRLASASTISLASLSASWPWNWALMCENRVDFRAGRFVVLFLRRFTVIVSLSVATTGLPSERIALMENVSWRETLSWACRRRVEILVLGNNVEAARRVAGRRRSEVIGQGEVEGIPSRGVHLDQPDLGRMLPDLLHEADLQPLLSLAEQQGHLDGRFPDPAQIDRLDVLEIDEDVVIRLL